QSRTGVRSRGNGRTGNVMVLRVLSQRRCYFANGVSGCSREGRGKVGLQSIGIGAGSVRGMNVGTCSDANHAGAAGSSSRMHVPEVDSTIGCGRIDKTAGVRFTVDVVGYDKLIGSAALGYRKGTLGQSAQK